MKKTLVGFGASSMKGIGDDTGGGFFKRIQPAFDHYRFVNLGVGGNTTRDMMERCGQVTIHQPCDLIVLLGCNDLPRANDGNSKARTSVGEYCRNLSRILTTIKGQRSIFITSFPVDPCRSGVSVESFDLYMGHAVGIAIRSGYEIVDLYALMRASPCNYLAPDGVHFNGEGHQVIADLVTAHLMDTTRI